MARAIFGLSLIAFGVQHCMYGHFQSGMPPFPAWLTQQSWPAYLVGAVMVALGGLFVTGHPRKAVGELTAFFLFAAACTHLLRMHAVLVNGDSRTGMLEALSLAASALAFGSAGLNSVRQLRCFQAAKWVFCLSMFTFGVQHFLYLRFVATLVPYWIPFPWFWTVLFGLGFICASLGILLGVLRYTAVVLLSSTFGLLFLVLHIPRIAVNWNSGAEWSSGLVALALSCGSLAFL